VGPTVGLDVRLVQLRAVDEDVAARPLGDGIAGEADQALHERPARAAHLLRGLGRVEDDDLAAVRVAEVVDEAVGEYAVERPASQPWPGRAQWSVGSIELDGIRYGLTTQALIASTIAIAPTIVTIQSIAIRHGRGNPAVRRSSGFARVPGRPLVLGRPQHRWVARRRVLGAVVAAARWAVVEAVAAHDPVLSRLCSLRHTSILL
jgi:hypothetical protein